MLFFFSQNNTPSIQTVGAKNISERENIRREKFEPAKKLLLESGVEFDPEALLSNDWKEKLQVSFFMERYEMQTTLRTSNKIKGVQIADILILPKNVELTGDTVILANTIVYEGTETFIHGLGKNIYVFPIKKTGHLKNSFMNAMETKDISDNLPEIGSRTIHKFPLDFTDEKTSLKIEVTGSGAEDWQVNYLREHHELISTENIAPEYTEDKTPQGVGATGSPGTPGDVWPFPPSAGISGPGHCFGHPNGFGGDDADGDDGRTGKSPIAEDAGKGGSGGTGGTIDYTIEPPYDSSYVFISRGGTGGRGGPGGQGGPGGNGHDGDKGGRGADCSCLRGGAGNGGDGGKGGGGGRGGEGSKGGLGGDGGPGGQIFVTYPFNFNTNLIGHAENGGQPGQGGERGPRGLEGYPGVGGPGGDPATTFNCSSSTTFSGNSGGVKPSLGEGLLGQPGNNGTVVGSSGGWHPNRLNPPTVAGACGGLPDYNQYPTSGCAPGFIYNGNYCTRSGGFTTQCNRFGGYDEETCQCFGGCDAGGCSPIVVDVLGNGFAMTGYSDGVDFDLDNDGFPEHLSWIAAGSDDSWLALDRNNNGQIDGGRELFGNVTPQPPPPTDEEMNGFLALAEYDTAAFGGNSDGKINHHDSVFSRLRLWRDENHNGVSESCEMKTLPEMGLRKIDLDYRTSRRTDEFGNRFRYKAKVRDAQDAQLGRWAWDVYLVIGQ